MDAIVVEHYEFTAAAKGSLLSFDLPEPLLYSRPKGLASQPWAQWDEKQARLSLIYPNLPRAIHLDFEGLPQALINALAHGESILVCQTRFGLILRAHFFRASRQDDDALDHHYHSSHTIRSSSSLSETQGLSGQPINTQTKQSDQSPDLFIQEVNPLLFFDEVSHQIIHTEKTQS